MKHDQFFHVKITNRFILAHISKSNSHQISSEVINLPHPIHTQLVNNDLLIISLRDYKGGLIRDLIKILF